MIFTQVHLEGISGLPDPLAFWLFSVTGIGGSLRPMEIHKMTSYVIHTILTTLTTFDDLGANNAPVSTRCWPGIFNK